jgi:SAM-dependent methyltransferase
VSPVAIVEGQLFASSQVHGVVEADFFDWVAEVDGGEAFIRVLARRLVRFAWHNVEHDVLKVLYESIISTAQRKQLGEYYTPDWLADRIVNDAVTQPLDQRVLDPSCGSGTFLFHAVRRYLEAAQTRGIANGEALTGLTQHVIGMDIHPVAVTFARVTYLLAIGPERLQADDRPPISIPVYLGDSIQWGQERTLFTSDALVIPTVGGQLWATELRFPQRTLVDAGRFDQLVGELARLASNRKRGSAVPKLQGVLRHYAVHPEDEQTITETFRKLCQLYDEGRNHIWGYYVRNLARPVWLARPENRVSVLIGNPPWLSYRFMTDEMQKKFRELSEERGLWAGASVATNQDLSALFILRAIERYLDDTGRFGFVMPWSALRGRQFAGFRSGRYSLHASQRGLTVAFERAWDLHAMKPTFFPVPCSVIQGRRADRAKPLGADVEAWSGRLPQANVPWRIAEAHITRGAGNVREAKATPGSPYAPRFSQGATIVPRVLLVVEKKTTGPLGAGAGRWPIQSSRSPNEKAPWKSLPALDGNVERQFVRAMHTGETVLPYRLLDTLRAVIPWDGQRLLDGSDERLASFPGLADWWLRAESAWNDNRSSVALSLRQRLDYQRTLSQQFPIPQFRVVYSASGMYLAAAIVRGDSIIEHKLYWGTASSLDEARYLEAILNSEVLTRRVRPLQTRGEHNPRDYDKYIWQLPIPMFSPADPRHARLTQLAESAETIAAAVVLPIDKRFETLRRTIRTVVAESETGKEIENEVSVLLLAPDTSI